MKLNLYEGTEDAPLKTAHSGRYVEFKEEFKVYTFDEPVVFCKYPDKNIAHECGLYAVASVKTETGRVLAVCQEHFEKYLIKYAPAKLKDAVAKIRPRVDFNKDFVYFGYPDERGRFCNLRMTGLSPAIIARDIARNCPDCIAAGRTCFKGGRLKINLYEGI